MLLSEAKKILNRNGYLMEVKKYRTSPKERKERDVVIDPITKAKRNFLDEIKSVVADTGICVIDFIKWDYDSAYFKLDCTSHHQSEFENFVAVLNELINSNKFGKIFKNKIDNNIIVIDTPEEKIFDVNDSLMSKFRYEVARTVANKMDIDSQKIYDVLLGYEIGCFNWDEELSYELASDISGRTYGDAENDELLDCLNNVCKELAPKYEKYVKQPKTISNNYHFEKALNDIIPTFKQAINFAAKETKLTTN